MKPHIFRTFYPKSGRHYWRVSPMPKTYDKYALLWRQARAFVNKLNQEYELHEFDEFDQGIVKGFRDLASKVMPIIVTDSPSLYIQQCGRAKRPKNNTN